MSDDQRWRPRWKEAHVLDTSMLGWCSPMPGALGEDGGQIFVWRGGLRSRRCRQCGRRGLLWHAIVSLPAPFSQDHWRDGGCSRAHAVEPVPSTWQDIAAECRRDAVQLRSDATTAAWRDRLMHRWEALADKASWLHDRSAAERHVALRVWAANGDLNLEQTETIVRGVLADPCGFPS